MSQLRMRRSPGRDAQCSFCGKGRDDVRLLVSGQRGLICDECIVLSHRVLRGKAGDARPTWRRQTPAAIKAALDERVIGQERAKRILSVALYNHHKRVAHRRHLGTALAKSNILLIGPSGTGKTLLAQTLAGIADAPFAIVDATSLTETGYVGADVESILLRLLRSAEYDVEAAEGGILYIDEIDKIARKETWSGGRDIAGEGVQQALLRILEGAVVSVPLEGDRRLGRGAALELDTTDILFIAGGSFAGLDDIVRARAPTPSVGYRSSLPLAASGASDIPRQVSAEDLVAFGFIPELVGRLPVLAPLDGLDEADLLAILTRPRNALIEQYKLLFRLSGVELQFDDAALRAIAGEALRRGAGARGLRAILERLLLDLMFALPEHPGVRTLVIDRDAVEGGQAGRLLRSATPGRPDRGAESAAGRATDESAMERQPRAPAAPV
jgi:ATP-dependent Clp protease ATP-binding subunit ClpX